MEQKLATDAIRGYQILRPIGEGGMARVYLALQESLRREVALKIMSPRLALDEGFEERFLAEAQLTARLNHPNIMVVHDVGRSGEHFYIATELLSGGSLNDRSLGTTTAKLRVMRGVARGLAYAHQQRVVHRDIKPSNILFRDAFQPVITDFGIAKALDATRALTLADSVVGTPQFMSPEQANGQPLDGRSDLYSLGIMLYQLLTGHVPFNAPDALAVLLMHLNREVPPLPAEHEVLQPLLNCLLAKDPNQRFADAQCFIDALTPFLGRISTGQVTPIFVPSDPHAAVKPQGLDSPIANELTKAFTKPQAKASAPSLRSVVIILGCLMIALFAGGVLWQASLTGVAIAKHARQSVVISAEKSALLETVRTRIRAAKYFAPVGDCAFDSIQRLLTSMPTDPDALALLRELSVAVSITVGHLWARQRQTEALALLRQAQERLPNDLELTSLRAELQLLIDGDPPQSAREQEVQSVAKLLERALRLREAAQLTSPPGDNAVELYWRVLRDDVSNRAARQALDTIALDYLRVANLFLDRKRADQALLQVRNGLKADPQNEQLRALYRLLERESVH